MQTSKAEARKSSTQANDELSRAGNHAIHALDGWIKWRGEKIQGLRREMAALTKSKLSSGLADHEPLRRATGHA
jgi:hypothetical protein